MRLSAEPIRELLSKEIEDKRAHLKHPFYLFYDGKNPDSVYYIKGIIRVLERFSIPFVSDQIDVSHVEDDLKKVRKYAQDHFTIIARPLGVKKEMEDLFISSIRPQLDPDIMSDENLGRLLRGENVSYPATVESVRRIIEYYDIDIDGKNALIIGRSQTVGLPLALLLQNMNATITIAHTHTSRDHLKRLLKETDILALASGDSTLVEDEDLHPGEVILDCGYHVGHGDLAFVPDIDVSYTPVPGGIGVLTSLCLILNAIKSDSGLE